MDLGIDNLLLNSFFAAILCLQGNFEFGISRIIKSLEPYEKKLGTDTWFYAKRCFLALAEQVYSKAGLSRVSYIRGPNPVRYQSYRTVNVKTEKICFPMFMCMLLTPNDSLYK